MSPPLVSALGLHRDFDGGAVQALVDTSLEIHAGEYIALCGPSGCGKSTLLQLIGALDTPDRGTLSWNGQSYDSMSNLASFRARQLGFVFQSFHLLPTLSALDNVQLPMFEREWTHAERRDRALALLDAVGVQHRKDNRPNQLSGGERQRVAIARALANEPTLLLADEPTGSLDSASATKVLALLRALHEERGLTLVIVTHDATVAAQAGRSVSMKDGRIIADAAVAAA